MIRLFVIIFLFVAATRGQDLNDPYWPRQKDKFRSVGLPALWKNNNSETRAVAKNIIPVVILDTGLDCSHEEIRESVIAAETLVGRNGCADEARHGTFVIGEIAARRNNSIGIVGGVENANIFSYQIWRKMTGPNGQVWFDGSDAKGGSIYNAIEKVKLLPYERIVVNMSFGSEGSQDFKELLISLEGKALLVAAAGNNGKDNRFFPCAWDLPHLICVGGNTDFGKLSPISNYGSWVHITAPSDYVTSTAPGGAIVEESGTSVAAPFVSIVAQMLFEEYPQATPAQVKRAILEGAAFNPNLVGLIQEPRTLNGVGALNALRRILNNESQQVVTPIQVHAMTSTWGEEAGAFALGDIVTLWGENFIDGDACVANTIPLPVELCGIKVTLNSRFEVPLFSVHPGQINVALPSDSFQIWGVNNVLEVSRHDSFGVKKTAVFTLPFATQKANLNLYRGLRRSDGSWVSKDNPATSDEEVAMLATGLGLSSPVVRAGRVAKGTERVVEPVIVKIVMGENEIEVASLAVPSTSVPGLYEIRFTVPRVEGQWSVKVKVGSKSQTIELN